MDKRKILARIFVVLAVVASFCVAYFLVFLLPVFTTEPDMLNAFFSAKYIETTSLFLVSLVFDIIFIVLSAGASYEAKLPTASSSVVGSAGVSAVLILSPGARFMTPNKEEVVNESAVCFARVQSITFQGETPETSTEPQKTEKKRRFFHQA